MGLNRNYRRVHEDVATFAAAAGGVAMLIAGYVLTIMGHDRIVLIREALSGGQCASVPAGIQSQPSVL
jgi:hypothetical protein